MSLLALKVLAITASLRVGAGGVRPLPFPGSGGNSVPSKPMTKKTRDTMAPRASLVMYRAGGDRGEPSRTRNTANVAFFGKVGRVPVQKRPLFQALACQIRYPADQWKFLRDQRIRGALTTEKQWNVRASEKSENRLALFR
jgi:hypothetical protein